jgi:hypothetical protein
MTGSEAKYRNAMRVLQDAQRKYQQEPSEETRESHNIAQRAVNAAYAECLAEFQRKDEPISFEVTREQRKAVLVEVLAMLLKKEQQHLDDMKSAWENNQKKRHTRIVERSIAVDDIIREIKAMMEDAA